MIKLNQVMGILIGMSISFTTMANEVKFLGCNTFSEIRTPIKMITPDFNWTNPGCQIVATKSIFPKEYSDGTINFEKGVQVFVYQDKQLKFICIPGWVCKRW